MRKDWKCFVPTVVVATALVAQAGCVTRNTLRAAQGEGYTENGEPVKNPHPDMYVLVPFAAIADIAILPVYPIILLVGWGNMGVRALTPSDK